MRKNKSSHESKSSGITILKRDKRIFSAECLGIIDTGNALSEPISGLPVIVLGAKRHSEFAQAANVPIPMRTAAGESLLFGLKPKNCLLTAVPLKQFLPSVQSLMPRLFPPFWRLMQPARSAARIYRERRCGFSAKDAAAGRCFRSNRIYSKSSKVEKED